MPVYAGVDFTSNSIDIGILGLRSLVVISGG